jgi:hypothetical protein
MKKNLLFISVQVLFCAAFAQNFKYKAKVTEVKSTGFYKIQLSPEIVAKSNKDLADLRLTSSDGREIPFILNHEPATFYEQDFVPLKIEENSTKGNIQTLIIINTKSQSINNLVLEMKNAMGEKKIRISGSDDKKNWYMLHQGFPLTVPGDASSTKIYQAIDFPISDYKWFSISLIDTIPMALNILRVGNYKQKVIFGNYSTFPLKNFIQKDSSDKKSYVLITLKEPNAADRMKVFISKPEQYLRNASYYITREEEFHEVMNVILNSDLENCLDISSIGIKINSIPLTIENNDNEPLKIDSIQLQQLTKYLSAKLETGKTYFLQFGDTTLEMPRYDLVYFANKIPRDIQIINHQEIESNSGGIVIKENTSNTKVFIWVGLILAALLLAFMTNKMLKEVKNREKG